MNNFTVVKILDCAQQVVHDRLDMQDLQIDVALENLFEVRLCKFHHHVNCREACGILRLTNLNEVHNTWVPQLAKESYLSENSLAVGLIIENVVHFLDGHAFARRQLCRLRNLAIASLSKNLFAPVVVTNLPSFEVGFLGAQLDSFSLAWLFLFH